MRYEFTLYGLEWTDPYMIYTSLKSVQIVCGPVVRIYVFKIYMYLWTESADFVDHRSRFYGYPNLWTHEFIIQHHKFMIQQYAFCKFVDCGFWIHVHKICTFRGFADFSKIGWIADFSSYPI